MIEKQDGCQRDLAFLSNEEMSKTPANVAPLVSRPCGDREAELRGDLLKAKTAHRDEMEMEGKTAKRETDRIPSTKDSARTGADSLDRSVVLEFPMRVKQHGYELTQNVIESGVHTNGYTAPFSVDGFWGQKLEKGTEGESSMRARESQAEEDKNQIPISKDRPREESEARSGSTKRAPLKPVRSKKCKVNKEPNPQEQMQDARRSPGTTKGPEIKMANERVFDFQNRQQNGSTSEQLNSHPYFECSATHETSKEKELTANGHYPPSRGLSGYGRQDIQDIRGAFFMNFGAEDDKLLCEDPVQVFNALYGSKFSASDQMPPLQPAILGQRTRESDITMRNRQMFKNHDHSSVLQKNFSMVKTKRRLVVTAWHPLVQSQETKASHELNTSIHSQFCISHLNTVHNSRASSLTFYKGGLKKKAKKQYPKPFVNAYHTLLQGLQGHEAVFLH